jgi:hypothetical protein
MRSRQKSTEQNYRFDPQWLHEGKDPHLEERKGWNWKRGNKPWRGREGSGRTVAAATAWRRPDPGGEWRARGGNVRRRAAATRPRRRARGRALWLWIGSGIATPFSLSRRGNKTGERRVVDGSREADENKREREKVVHVSRDGLARSDFQPI